MTAEQRTVWLAWWRVASAQARGLQVEAWMRGAPDERALARELLAAWASDTKLASARELFKGWPKEIKS